MCVWGGGSPSTTIPAQLHAWPVPRLCVLRRTHRGAEPHGASVRPSSQNQKNHLTRRSPFRGLFHALVQYGTCQAGLPSRDTRIMTPSPQLPSPSSSPPQIESVSYLASRLNLASLGACAYIPFLKNWPAISKPLLSPLRYLGQGGRGAGQHTHAEGRAGAGGREREKERERERKREKECVCVKRESVKREAREGGRESEGERVRRGAESRTRLPH